MSIQKTINGAAFIQISDSPGIRGYRSTTGIESNGSGVVKTR